jgi:pimeloyl-ACP methyl ester carboxylesterase
MSSIDPAEMAALAFLRPERPKVPTPDAPDEWRSTPAGRIALWQRGAGPRVLLVHGWSGAHADLNAFIEPLVAAGHEVIGIDLPAHGQSEGQIASTPDLARALLHVGEACGPFTGVLAHSVGCAAVGVALRDGLRAARAVLIAPPGRYADFASEFARMVGADPQCVLAALRKRDIDVDSVDFPAMAPKLQASALIIHSRDDRIVPYVNGETLAKVWPEAPLVSHDGLGHGRILGDAGVIARTVAFFTA